MIRTYLVSGNKHLNQLTFNTSVRIS